MKFILAIVLFVSSLSASMAQKKEWKRLKKTALDLGFCIYSPGQKYVEEHQELYDSLKAAAKANRDEIIYFPLQEEWAKKRTTAWMKRTKRPIKSGLLFYNIDSHLPKGKGRNDHFGFFILSTLDSLGFGGRTDTAKIMTNIHVLDSGSVVQNAMWREFMTGRPGILPERINFNIYGKDTPQKYNAFINAYESYRRKWIRKH